MDIVETIFHRFNDIPAEYVGKALSNAAHRGHVNIVELILHHRTDIPTHYFRKALSFAIFSGHTDVVDLIRGLQMSMNC
jgi:hypothetical protein